MLTGTYYDNEILHAYTDFFMKNIVNEDYMDYFDIYISDNIGRDVHTFDTDINTQLSTKIAGINILPYQSEDTITILISQNKNTPEVVFHELSHMVDFVQFAKKFCKGDLSSIRCHTYYRSFIYWSEFRAKQIDIPYMHLIVGMLNGDTPEEAMQYFKDNIHDFFYDKYAEKLLNKSDVTLRDIFWYLGEIVVCNLYDCKNHYPIHQEIAEKYEGINELYEKVIKYLNFEQLAEDIDSFHNLILAQTQ